MRYFYSNSVTCKVTRSFASCQVKYNYVIDDHFGVFLDTNFALSQSQTGDLYNSS